MKFSQKKYLSVLIIALCAISSPSRSFANESKTESSDQNSDIIVGNSDEIAIDPEYLKLLEDRRKAHEIKKATDALDGEYQKEEAKSKQFPFSSDEIIQNRVKQNEMERATNIPIVTTKQVITSENLDVDNPSPIVIRTAPSKVSSVIFFDASGAPWPIEYALAGDDEMFTITKAGSAMNVATIIAGKNFVQSNAVIGLVGLPTTIVFDLQADQRFIDSRKSLRLPRLGPKAKPMAISTNSVIDNLPPELLDLINGSKLAGSKLLKMEGVKSGNAYYYNGYIYLTSKYLLRWPASLDSASSPTGKNVYKLHKSARNLIFSVDGETAYAKIKDFSE